MVVANIVRNEQNVMQTVPFSCAFADMPLAPAPHWATQ
jgi:hypothetical protein